MKLEEYEQLHPHVQAEGLVFLTPNTHCAWRVDTLLTKEPDTIAWINGMAKDSVLFDVGANMGQYSMVAAQRGITVHAFEPDSQNFALMCRNLALNKLKGHITPWPIALTDTIGLDTFYVTHVMPGGSCNSFGEQVDYHLQPKKFKFQQGCFGTTIDIFSSQMKAYADHIKIDVDGLEHKIIAGAEFALTKAQSVLVELNTRLPEHVAIIEKMNQLGFWADMVTAEKARRKDGAFKGVGNVIFFRDDADFLDVPADKWKKL
jgi:FkbM family methyltransferase